VPSKASTNSSAAGSSGIESKNDDDDDDDLLPPPFKIRKLQSPDKVCMHLCMRIGEARFPEQNQTTLIEHSS